MAQVGITARYTLLDYLRSRRFVILLTIGLLISVILTLVIAHFRPGGILDKPLDFYATFWGSTASLIVILSGIFFGGDAISAEFQNKTGYFTVPNPIRRSSIYVGKFVAAFIASTLILLVFTAITVGNGLYYFGANIPYQFGESFLFAWFYLLAVLGLTFLFSSLFKSSSYSILVSFLIIFVAFNIIEGIVSSVANIEPWFILSYASGIIGNVLMIPYPLTQTRVGVTVYAASIPEGLAIMAGYFIITAALGLLLFERKEFN
jgi:ABC-2 type transport system permease protein